MANDYIQHNKERTRLFDHLTNNLYKENNHDTIIINIENIPKTICNHLDSMGIDAIQLIFKDGKLKEYKMIANRLTERDKFTIRLNRYKFNGDQSDKVKILSNHYHKKEWSEITNKLNDNFIDYKISDVHTKIYDNKIDLRYYIIDPFDKNNVSVKKLISNDEIKTNSEVKYNFYDFDINRKNTFESYIEIDYKLIIDKPNRVITKDYTKFDNKEIRLINIENFNKYVKVIEKIYNRYINQN
jgi:hypothetical protein